MDEFKFVFILEDATSINHIVVFLLPDSNAFCGFMGIIVCSGVAA